MGLFCTFSDPCWLCLLEIKFSLFIKPLKKTFLRRFDDNLFPPFFASKPWQGWIKRRNRQPHFNTNTIRFDKWIVKKYVNNVERNSNGRRLSITIVKWTLFFPFFLLHTVWLSYPKTFTICIYFSKKHKIFF